MTGHQTAAISCGLQFARPCRNRDRNFYLARLAFEIAYTPGSLYLSQALKENGCDIGHTGADDVIADVEAGDSSDLFIFMGLHSGLFSLVGARYCASIDSLSGRSIGVDAKTSGFVLVLERMLHARGFDVDDYQLIEVVDGKAAIAHCWKEDQRDSVDGTFCEKCSGRELQPAC